MSEFHRLRRIVKSLIPRFSERKSHRNYQLSDARHMINELGVQMPPEVLSRLVEDDQVLDDFLEGIIALEIELDREVITEFGAIDQDLIPRVYVEEKLVGFSVTHRGEEIVFAEYEWN